MPESPRDVLPLGQTSLRLGGNLFQGKPTGRVHHFGVTPNLFEKTHPHVLYFCFGCVLSFCLVVLFPCVVCRVFLGQWEPPGRASSVWFVLCALRARARLGALPQDLRYKLFSLNLTAIGQRIFRL